MLQFPLNFCQNFLMKRLTPILLILAVLLLGGCQSVPIHGQGTYTAPNGNKYVGEWKNSKPHGQGTLTYADGGKVIPGKKIPSPTDAEEGGLFLENVI